MKTLYVINGMVKTKGVVSVSGGDIRLMEILRNNSDNDNYVLTTPNGAEFLEKYKDVKYSKLYTLKHQLSGGVVDNLSISIKSFFLRGTGASEFRDGIVYSSCEHLYDILPALRLKYMNKCRWYAVYHWVEDYPWKEKRGNTPWFPRYAYWMNRYLAGLLIKLFSDKVLAVSDQTEEKLLALKKINPNKVKAVYCGVNFDEIQSFALKYKSEKGKKYDAVFMKRLNYGKGVLDLLEIWKEVVKTKPSAKLAIIGDGSDEIIEKINEYIRMNSLEDNIDLLGVIYDMEKKFRVINSSKVFLLPTHEENWAIVIGEAMAMGVPVVVSRLKEIVPIWKDNVVWCNVSDIQAFAKAVNALLDDPSVALRLEDKANKFVKVYDWKAIARDEFSE